MSTDSLNNGESAKIDNEIDLGAVFKSLWAAKFFVGGVALVGFVIAVVVVLLLPNTYRAEALLAPNEDTGAKGMSALASQYGGLASLAGIDLGGSNSSKTDWGLEVLKSRKFVSEFIQRHDLLVPLMASESWDAESGVHKLDESIFDQTTNEWVRKIRKPRVAKPSMLEAHEVFVDDVLSARQDRKTGFVTVTITHHSPVLAQQWLELLVHDLNKTIMQQEVGEAEQAIEFLDKQLQSTALSELRNVFSSLIEEQTKTVMLAKVSDEYLFKTLDPPVIPEEAIRPKRGQIILVTVIFSALAAMLVVLVAGPRFYGRTD